MLVCEISEKTGIMVFRPSGQHSSIQEDIADLTADLRQQDASMASAAIERIGTLSLCLNADRITRAPTRTSDRFAYSGFEPIRACLSNDAAEAAC